MAPVYDFRHVELDKIGRGKRIVKPPGGECSDIFGIQNGGSPKQEQQITPRKPKNYMQSNIFTPDSPDSVSSNNHSPVTPAKVLDTQERLFGGSPDEDTPRRVVYRQRSSIFEEEVTDSRPRTTPVRRTQVNPITGEPVSQNGTPNGGSPANGTPNGTTNGSVGYIRRNQINPITGEPMCQNGTSNGSANRTPNKITNGCNKYFRRNPINPITGEPMCLNGTPNGSACGTPNGAINIYNGYMNGHFSPESPMNGNSVRVRNPPGGKSSGIF